MSSIRIRGARQHNLKNLSLELPRDALIVITGVSGSGKSSLAFDTVYAEGQRRYVESLSAYARQFLELMDKPDVDSIEGLSPAISIEQKSVSRNPRSTVGTVTEIYDYLRLLYARVGKVYCHSCNRPIESQTIQQMTDHIQSLPDKSRIHILAPIVRGKKGEFDREFERLRRQGYTRVQVNGDTIGLDEEIKLTKNKKHTISVYVDRLVLKDGIRNRLADSLETALRLTDGLVVVEELGTKEKPLAKSRNHLMSEHFACPHCNVSYSEISPRLFSFNSPFGACETCKGIGARKYFDEKLIVANPKLSIREGAIAPWAHRESYHFYSTLQALADHFAFDLHDPYESISRTAQRALMYGVDEGTLSLTEVSKQDTKLSKPIDFEGAIPYLERKKVEAEAAAHYTHDLDRYMSEADCTTCGGSRLRKEALYVRVGDKNISEFCALSVEKAAAFFNNLVLNDKQAAIAEKVLHEVQARLGFLKNVGLTYLTLDRKAGTLSGGEGQRIRLATQVGSGLVGVMYILDEPSIGLHQRDNRRLIETLQALRDLGNTVIVVEHDDDTMRSADHILDLGPGAGRLGGEVVAQGSPEEVCQNQRSLTGGYLSGRLNIPLPDRRREVTRKKLVLHSASENNLKSIDVEIPLGLFVCVTGVSGSGKSSLVVDTLYRHLKQRLYGSRERAGALKDIQGLHYIDKVIDIDQSPIGRTPRSNPATYTGLFTPIRELFAMLPESKVRGYKAGRYSFNVKGGRCETCQGDGIIRIEMHFLPDVYVRCDACLGRRYNSEVLDITYKGKNIFQVLEMTVNQGAEFFESVPKIAKRLTTLQEVGLGYIKLGQAATTLSGGEAQRIKLSRELSKTASGRTLYILDEPTTGLHFEDVRRLLKVLQRLVETGNTLVVIEHNLDIIKSADHVIDLGPEGGDHGGELIARGTPEEICDVSASHTGQFLRTCLENQGTIEAQADATSTSLES